MSKRTFQLLILLLSWTLICEQASSQTNNEGMPFPRLNKNKSQATHLSSEARNHNLNHEQKQPLTSRQLTEIYQDQLEEVAKWYGQSKKEFINKFEHQACLKVDSEGRLYHACTGPATTTPPIPEEYSEAVTAATAPAYSAQIKPQTTQPALSQTIINQTIPASMAFELESLPGAARTIYLDFDGHITQNTGWNSGEIPERWVFESPPIDFDGSGPVITDWEKIEIIKVWLQVAEDFSPFEVNVTTKEPPLDKLIKTDASDQEYGIRVVITKDVIPYVTPSAGGIAYFGSFEWNQDAPAFVFARNLGNIRQWIADVATHEVGHTLKLSHDGINGEQYHYGTNTWAPIMGVVRSKPNGQWSKGDYEGATNKEDDIAIIARMLPLRKDLETRPSNSNPLSAPVYGRIDANQNKDIFIIDTEKGELNISHQVSPRYPNLGLVVKLFDHNKEQVLPISASSPLSFSVEKARYYIELSGSPIPEAGNTSYGSVGYYTLSASQPNTRPHTAFAELSTSVAIANNDTISIINIQGSDKDGDQINYAYSWEIGAPSEEELYPSQYVELESQNSSEIDLSLVGADLSGKYLRAAVTSHDSLGAGTTFKTRPVFVKSPNPIYRIGVNETINQSFASPYTPSIPSSLQKSILINEISKGYPETPNAEWIELIIQKPLDLRGFSLQSHINKSQGLVFSQDELWANVPEGTLILIYNGEARDPLIGEETINVKGNQKIVVSSQNVTLFAGTWPNLTQPTDNAYISLDFEDASKTSYAIGTVVIGEREWILDDALIGTSDGDEKEGLRSLRMRNGALESATYLDYGIGAINFQYARSNFTGDRLGTSPVFVVEYCHIDNPNLWLQIGPEVNLSGIDSLTAFSEIPEIAGKVKIRIRKISGTNDKRYNIENLQILPNDKRGYVKIEDSQGLTVERIDFHDSPSSPTPEFLQNLETMMWLGSSESDYLNPAKWMSSLWVKPSMTPAAESLSLSPGDYNSPENRDFVISLADRAHYVRPVYSILEKPADSNLTIHPLTGHLSGVVHSPGRHRLKIQVSKNLETSFMTHDVLVTQSFEDKFKDNPALVSNPYRDDDGDGLSNLKEYILGRDPLQTGESNPLQLGLTYGDSGAQVGINYSKNLTSQGVELWVEWSTDLVNWSSEGVEDSLSSAQGNLEKRLAYKNLDPAQQRLFVRLASRAYGTIPNSTKLQINNAGILETTTPQGIVRVGITQGSGTAKRISLISLPMLQRDTSLPKGGKISDIVAPDTFTYTSTNSNASTPFPNGSISNPDKPFLLLITSGQAEGEMFLVSTSEPNTSSRITVTYPLTNTLDIANLGIQPNDTFEVFPCDTLSSFFGAPETTLIKGGSNPQNADTVTMMTGSSWTTYYFNTTLNRWTRVGLGNHDSSNTPILPYHGLQYSRIANTPLEFYVEGEVPMQRRITKIRTSGTSLLANFFPKDTTLKDLKLEQTPNWKSSPRPQQADKVAIVSGGSVSNYYHDGDNWRRVGLGSILSDFSPIPLGTAVHISKISQDAGLTGLVEEKPY